MSLRVAACFLYVGFFAIYAWRNWFVSLCAVIILMSFLEHPDMPKSIGGIQGLNPWNVLMLSILLAWYKNRTQEGLVWDMPRYVVWLGAAYFFVIVWSFIRLMMDVKGLDKSDFYGDFTMLSGVSEFLINCVKWVLPGILLFDACRTRRRIVIGLGAALLVYFLLALQVIKHMPLNAVAMDGAELSKRASKVLASSVGYHRVNLSMMFSGASWAVLTALMLGRNKKEKFALLGVAAAIALAQALTGGRAGYVTWGLLGLILCLLRWRSLLPVLPITVIAVCIFLPSVRDRMMQGFASSSGQVIEENSTYEMTSGRNIAWGYVIPKIWESPIIGYGRQAMIRVGIYQQIMDEYDGGESFPHPHNAYLELLLDNGWVGFFLVIPFYLVILWHCVKVLLDRSDPLFAAVGGTCFALVMALLIASMGSQTFYPREGSVGMWAAIGLLLRLSLERTRAQDWGTSLFSEENENEWSENVAEPVLV